MWYRLLPDQGAPPRGFEEFTEAQLVPYKQVQVAGAYLLTPRVLRQRGGTIKQYGVYYRKWQRPHLQGRTPHRSGLLAVFISAQKLHEHEERAEQGLDPPIVFLAVPRAMAHSKDEADIIMNEVYTAHKDRKQRLIHAQSGSKRISGTSAASGF